MIRFVIVVLDVILGLVIAFFAVKYSLHTNPAFGVTGAGGTAWRVKDQRYYVFIFIGGY
jgi:hypothetical protein